MKLYKLVIDEGTDAEFSMYYTNYEDASGEFDFWAEDGFQAAIYWTEVNWKIVGPGDAP